MIWIYDIEIYRNYFGCIFKNVKTKEIKEFIIFKERNDFDLLIDFISDQEKWLVGYNSFSFDNQLLNYMYKSQFGLSRADSDFICNSVYEIAKSVITDREFSSYKYNLPFKFLDLMKLGGIFKSLKLVGVNLKWHKLQDLPIPWENEILETDLELLHTYNLNDVEITERLYEELLPKIRMKYQISKLYNINAYTESDSGLANRLLEKFYSESTGLEIKEFKDLRTTRKMIPFSQVIFHDIKFETPELNALLDTMHGYTYFLSTPFFKKHIIFDGVKYQLGVGGIHSVDEPGKFEADNKTKLIDCDIASMYPSIIINNNIHPQHLGEHFIYKYKEVKDLRIKAKHEGNTPVNDALKIVLNSTFGKMLYNKHWLYDPLAGLRITINGQLYLLMLIEQLVLNKFKVISANTDGIITIVDKDREDLYKEICSRWEKRTGFDLEYTEYSKYIRRDINNYIAIKTNGKTKEKGIFQNSNDLMKGVDKPIITIALYEYFVNNKKIEDTIRNHTDIYDFCIAKKSDEKFTNEFHYLKNNEKIIDTLQKTVRFYISTNGGKLLKWKYAESDQKGNYAANPQPPIIVGETKQYTEYCVNRRVTIFNDYVQGPYDIDYAYYISEAYKILYQIENPQLTLF